MPCGIERISAVLLAAFNTQMFNHSKNVFIAVARVGQHCLNIGRVNSVFSGKVVVGIGSPPAALLHRQEKALNKAHQRADIGFEVKAFGQLKN
ncbi:hypothetical protein D3C80_1569030 [compost metagenome]